MNPPRPIPAAVRACCADLAPSALQPVRRNRFGPPALPSLSLRPTSFRLRRIALALGLTLTLPATAEWHGSLGFLSDYQYRGYTKNRSNPVVQGNLEYQHRLGWFAGATFSQVGFDDKPNRSRADFEARPYLGWAFQPAVDWRTELSVVGYLYHGDVFGRAAHYAEIYGSATYRGWLTGRVSFAPDAYRRGAEVFNYELSARHQLLDNLQLSAGLGYHQAGQLLHRDYFYWNAGATWYPGRHLAVDIRYSDAQAAAPNEEARYRSYEFYPRPLENQWLLSVILGF